MPRATLSFVVVFLLIGLPACQGNSQERADTESVRLFPVLQDGRWGYIDREGTLVVPARFEQAGPFSEGFATVRLNGLFGFIDERGEIAIEPQFEDALFFSNGHAPVQIDGAWRLIDPEGEEVSIQDFMLDAEDLVESERSSSALVRVRVDSLYGYASVEEEIVIPPRYEQAWHFQEGLARILLDGKWGFIDESGQTVIEPRFDLAWDFSDGLALVEVDRQYGYIDREGNYVWQPAR